MTLTYAIVEAGLPVSIRRSSSLMLELEDLTASCQIGKLDVKWERPRTDWRPWTWAVTYVDGLEPRSVSHHLQATWGSCGACRRKAGAFCHAAKYMHVVRELRKLRESLREGRAHGNLAAAPQTQRQVANRHSELVLGSICAPSPVRADIEMTWLPLSLPSESHTEHLSCPIQLETHSRGDSGRGPAG